MIEETEDVKDSDDSQDAATHGEGQDQDPKQSREENTGLMDSAQHSDAPGPFGTGDSVDPAANDD